MAPPVNASKPDAMTNKSNQVDGKGTNLKRDRSLQIRYAVLTLGLAVPLLITFAFVRNFYPFAASTVMMAGGDLQAGRTYYVMRGETSTGESIDLSPIELTNALSGRAWSLVGGTVTNKSFRLSSPHPANVVLLEAAGGIEKLPPASRLPDLLRSWGTIYNLRLSPSSPQRLQAVILDCYRWDSGRYSDYQHLVQSWRAEL